MGRVTAVLHLFPEDFGGCLVPLPRSTLLQDTLYDLLLVWQPIHREDIEPAEHHDAESTGTHGQPGSWTLPRQNCHGPSGLVSPGSPTGAHRHPGVPGREARDQSLSRVLGRGCSSRGGGAQGQPPMHRLKNTPSPFFLLCTRARSVRSQWLQQSSWRSGWKFLQATFPRCYVFLEEVSGGQQVTSYVCPWWLALLKAKKRSGRSPRAGWMLRAPARLRLPQCASPGHTKVSPSLCLEMLRSVPLAPASLPRRCAWGIGQGGRVELWGGNSRARPRCASHRAKS